jgi:putative SOS response-associated peptidase YedK
MAGLWKLWKNPKTNHWERTFAVITGEPNELMVPIRMTTFIEPRDIEEYETWRRPNALPQGLMYPVSEPHKSYLESCITYWLYSV